MNAALVWFRRDLRCEDHAALYHALRTAQKVYCVFVFDTEILDALPSRKDRRVEFIHQSVVALDAGLHALSLRAGGQGSGLIVKHGAAQDCIPELARQLGVQKVFTNRDYEPAAIERDQRVAASLDVMGIGFADFKDQVIFETDEILTQAGKPYSVFTPYKNAWLKKVDDFQLKPYPVEKYAARLACKPPTESIPSLAQLGFESGTWASLPMPAGSSGAQTLFDDFAPRMARYKEARDFPAVKGVSYLSVHIRFGTVSVRRLARFALEQNNDGAATWLSELIWREFYQAILYHFPHVVNRSFQRACDRIVWDDNPEYFAAWCEGRTGYPIVDAAMRQLNQTGYMHNRLRMITASFLCKDLGIDWREGEKYFADKLNDYDLASNNGGWQWAASTGCDAQPWFRIFNPVTQSKKFDPEGKFIRRYVPELKLLSDKCIHEPWQTAGKYLPPIVDHAEARERTLLRYGVLKAAD
ncbi:cryptochrome/photolyase family protein [Advenella sp. RU8]|uniref:cryptochrome/photolyase family protein n=1 Tax=Advenella sp. RU8 TaxID=3399575 RepID=UPI003AAE52D0